MDPGELVVPGLVPAHVLPEQVVEGGEVALRKGRVSVAQAGDVGVLGHGCLLTVTPRVAGDDDFGAVGRRSGLSDSRRRRRGKQSPTRRTVAGTGYGTGRCGGRHGSGQIAIR